MNEETAMTRLENEIRINVDTNPKNKEHDQFTRDLIDIVDQAKQAEKDRGFLKEVVAINSVYDFNLLADKIRQYLNEG